MLSRDNSGSSNSSFPKSSWVDWGIDWNGTNWTEGPFDSSAPLLPDPPALEALSADAGVSDVSGLGSLGFSAVSALGKLGNLVVEVLDLIFLMRWKMLDPSQARFWIRKLRQMGYNQQNIIYILADIEMKNFPLQYWSGSHLPFLAIVRITICRSQRHTIPGFIILLQKKPILSQKIKTG